MFPITLIAQALELERQSQEAGITQSQMMNMAGRALSNRLVAYSSSHSVARGPVVVLAGPGNNGGDGLIAARFLHDAGERVSVYLWQRNPEDDPLVAVLQARGVSIALAQNDTDHIVLRRWLRLAAWCIDALLGTGSNRPITGLLAQILDTVQSQRTGLLHVCAADCPSGLNCDTGEVDPCTLYADLTVMFGVAKRGAYDPRAFPACGLLEVGDIGLPPSQLEALPVQGLQQEDLVALLPSRVDWGHKGNFGKALCIGGSQRYPGAAVLSGLAAARTGAGLVTAAVPSSIQPGLVAAMPDSTFLPLAHQEGALTPAALDLLRAEWSRYTAVLLGCGLSCTDDTTVFVREFLEAYRNDSVMRDLPLVLDADALNCLARMEDWPSLLPPVAVLTPHPVEMGRLCGQDVARILESGWDLVAEKAAAWNCTIILKGYRTLIGTAEGKVYVLHQPNSALATAGTGDVLSGLLTGLLAQGQTPAEATRAAILIHSRAGLLCANTIGAAGTLASDVLAHVPQVVQQAYAESLS